MQAGQTYYIYFKPHACSDYTGGGLFSKSYNHTDYGGMQVSKIIANLDTVSIKGSITDIKYDENLRATFTSSKTGKTSSVDFSVQGD